jgi:hypothetical protein
MDDKCAACNEPIQILSKLRQSSLDVDDKRPFIECQHCNKLNELEEFGMHMSGVMVYRVKGLLDS